VTLAGLALRLGRRSCLPSDEHDNSETYRLAKRETETTRRRHLENRQKGRTSIITPRAGHGVVTRFLNAIQLKPTQINLTSNS
jgi:hypothetical protein